MIIIIIIIIQRPRTRNTENVAYENRSDPCGCWCAWYSEEGYGRKHQESIRESYYDRDSKDLHAGICANPQKGAQCMNRMIDLSDGLRPADAHKKNQQKTVIKQRGIIIMITKKKKWRNREGSSTTSLDSTAIDTLLLGCT